MYSFIKLTFFTAGIALTLLSASSAYEQSSTPAKPLFREAVNYKVFPKISGCTHDKPKASYHACLDPRSVYEVARKASARQKRPLMIVWGFDECPFCKIFEQKNFNSETPWTTAVFAENWLTDKQRAALPNQGADLQINVLRIHVRAPLGEQLAEELGVTDIARAKGWHRVWSPFVTVINPVTGKIVSQSVHKQGEKPCHAGAEFALNLEQLGYVVKDEMQKRKMCPAS